MAKAISGMQPITVSPVSLRSLKMVWTLRLVLGAVVGLGAVLFVLGGSWDIEWHGLIGRDRTLIPPHLMMLVGFTLSGIVALIAVIIDTIWARRNPLVAENSTQFAGTFYSSMGAYIAGFGALCAGIAFPLDAYWHALYGIDAAIWAPFHVMFIVGAGIIALGALYMVLSATHLASANGATGAVRTGYTLAVVCFAAMLGLMTISILDAYGGLGHVDLGFTAITLYPVLAAIIGMWLLVTASRVLPWRGSATTVVLAGFVLALIIFLFVPPALRTLMAIEQLSFRRPHSGLLVPQVVEAWPALPLLAAIMIDVFSRRAQRKGWSDQKLLHVVSLSSLIGWLPGSLIIPYFFVVYMLPNSGRISTGVFGFVLSMVVALAGTYAGTWLGMRTGNALAQVERVQVEGA